MPFKAYKESKAKEAAAGSSATSPSLQRSPNDLLIPVQKTSAQDDRAFEAMNIDRVTESHTGQTQSVPFRLENSMRDAAMNGDNSFGHN
jgi:hypothetical protein